MFLRDNFIHGDLHSGNVLYDVNTGKITVLDAGLVTAVKEDAFFEFGDFIRALVSQDIPMIAETLVVLHDYENDEKMGKPRTVFDVKLVQKDLEDIFQQRSDKWEGAALAQALGDITGACPATLPYHPGPLPCPAEMGWWGRRPPPVREGGAFFLSARREVCCE